MSFDEITKAIRQRQFLASKPIREIRPVDLQRDPEIIASRKYNGHFATAVVGPDGVTFYTASNLPLATLAGTSHWQNGEWKEALADAAPGTVLLGEIFIPSKAIEDLDAFQEWYAWHLNGWTGQHGPVLATFRAFDVLASGGKAIHALPYAQRHQLIPQALRTEPAPYTRLQQASAAIEVSRQMGIEGFVFWDANAPSLCKLSGQNKPRGGAWKIKPLFTENFVLLGLVNSNAETLVMRLGKQATDFKCGSGLTLAERRELIALHQQGKAVTLSITHYGYDDQGRPELPSARAFILA